MKIIHANKATFTRLLGAWFVLCLSFVPVVQAEEVQYYHLDALGSAVAATDETGAVLWMESYEPFGERRERADGNTNNLWYTGKAEDTAIGLNYFGARWYNSRVGRFLAMDPVGVSQNNVQSFNRYAYANNNPYKYVDPDGRVAETALDIVSFGLSVAAFKSDPSFINGLGVAYDGLATAVPFLPAGFGIIKNVGNGIDAVGDVTKRTTQSGIGVTRHSIQQKINRQVRSADELDAIKNPLDVRPVKVDKLGRPSQRSIGRKAEVARNPKTGDIVSVNPTSTKKAERLLRRQGGQ
jgi:RHS repeat-associated protein